MKITRSTRATTAFIRKQKKNGKRIGFVPTMGALHKGHLFLVKTARKSCDYVAVSIFVNPTQFGRGEDYGRYPRTFAADRKLLRSEKVDLLFYPRIRSMYAKDASTCVDETTLSAFLCGERRPGHFKGVATVVCKLFNIIEPDIVFFGQKDYQQACIIRRMVRDLNFPITIRMLPIVRERSGLAMSSRNRYLTKQQRSQAPALYESLRLAKDCIKNGERSPRIIIGAMKRLIRKKAPQARIDYIEIVDKDTLIPLKTVRGKCVVLLAVYFGRTRLIDNSIV